SRERVEGANRDGGASADLGRGSQAGVEPGRLEAEAVEPFRRPLEAARALDLVVAVGYEHRADGQAEQQSRHVAVVVRGRALAHVISPSHRAGLPGRPGVRNADGCAGQATPTDPDLGTEKGVRLRRCGYRPP